MKLFEWHERGREIRATTEPGAGLTIETRVDGWSWSTVELPEVAVHELREALVETFGDPQRAELLEAMHAAEAALVPFEEEKAAAQEVAASLEGDLARTEHERDEAVDRTTALEQQLRDALVQVEQHKSAGERADEVQRGLERQLAAVRGMLEPLGRVVGS